MAGCAENKEERALNALEDPELKEEIFNAIMNDSVYLDQFMDKMHAQYAGKGGYMRSRMMGRMMMGGMFDMDSLMLADTVARGRMMRHMLHRTDQDSVFCRQLSESIMQHEPLRRRIQNRMRMHRQ